MTAPIMVFSNCCCGRLAPENSSRIVAQTAKPKLGNHLFWLWPAIDAVIAITCLILGILGVASVISMPVAAAYAILGTSGLIALAWIAMLITIC